jgi:hypothetical protein
MTGTHLPSMKKYEWKTFVKQMSWAASDHRIFLRSQICLRLRVAGKVDFISTYVNVFFYVIADLNINVIKQIYPIILDHQSKNDDWTL